MSMDEQGCILEAASIFSGAEFNRVFDAETAPHGNNIRRNHPAHENVRVFIGAKSRGNLVCIGRNVSGPLYIKVQGHGNFIWIGDNCKLPDVRIIIKGHKGCVSIGEGTTSTGNSIITSGQNDDSGYSSVIIGVDGMWAKDVSIFSTDMHPIYDIASKDRINLTTSPTIIEPHVWLGQGASVMKSVTIGAGSCVGIGSVVTKSLPRYCVAAGVPAKVARSGTFWSRNPGTDETATMSQMLEKFPRND